MNITLLEAIVLSVVQGFAELFPVSSSGHLFIANELMKISSEPAILAFLHFPTTIALIIAYRAKIQELFLRGNYMQNSLNVAISIIPVIVVGLLLGDWIGEVFYSITIVAANLILVGIALIYIERVKTLPAMTSEISDISIKQALFIGAFQILALIPGTSRSGITTLGGMISGVRKPVAWDYSFILGIPVLSGVALYSTLKDYETVTTHFGDYLYLSIVLTFIVSYIAIQIVNRFKEKRFLTFFGIYRIILGILILLFVI